MHCSETILSLVICRHVDDILLGSRRITHAISRVARHLLASASKVLAGVEAEVDMSQTESDDTTHK